ncbi:dihydroorotase [Halarchaeum rubridurum]|uniref:Dihydroorotase n=1 Tax=Halarchaeum rubridurum TaxID=489911 RepID=A0A830FPN5_9EURY|nr:dihydroorotase [Halarchaeum rubridurum]MBP1954233.1 dihydroorotase [Halarchaeum rubridurum]GGM58355.1 dihydroorotase [Halarchaeum rubridurum]
MRVIRDATLADGRVRDVRLDGEQIDAVGVDLDGTVNIEADERLLLPGAIDAHVHFRQPGAGHKETWATGSRSAAAGGVTTVVDQPNTDPPTVTGAAYDEKESFAADSLVDYGLNGGVTEAWDPDALFGRPLFALGEVFLADSTGEMGIDAELFADAVERAAAAGVPVTVHAEDATLFDEEATAREDADAWSAYRRAEAEIVAAERTAEVAADADAQVHLAHTSTPEAVDVTADAGLTCEATPHHLLLSRDDYDDLGTFGRMNPPLRSENRRAELFERLVDGTLDVVATDHAPHTRAEKDTDVWHAPSGVPGVETMVPLLLAATRHTELTTERVRDVTARNPAELFGVAGKGRVAPGCDADLALYDTTDVTEIDGDDLHSKCGWTPFAGFEGVFPVWTMRRGERVWDAPEAAFGDRNGTNVRERAP